MAVPQDIPPEITSQIISLVPDPFEDESAPLNLSLVSRNWVDDGQRALMLCVALSNKGRAQDFIRCAKIRQQRTSSPLLAGFVVIAGSVPGAMVKELLVDIGLQIESLRTLYYLGFPWESLHLASKLSSSLTYLHGH